jgi:tetratricopeptide (TPR) repeat protein
MSDTEPKPTLAELQRSAHEFLKKERWSPAHKVLSMASQLYPESADVWSDLAAADRALGMLEPAISHYQKALELDPKLAFVHNNLGNALADKGRTRDAIDCYHRALVLQPRYPAALNSLAKVLLKEGKVQEAQRALERLFNMTRDFAPAFETLAELCEKQGDVQTALNHYISLASHYLGAGDPKKALWAMEACRRLGHRSAGLEANRCVAFLQLGRNEEARDAGRAALQLDPNHANAHVNLGSAYAALKDYPNAVALQRRATDLAPRLTEAFISLGNTLLEAGDPQGALAAHNKALELESSNPRAITGLAQAYQAMKRREEALGLYRQAISLSPSYPDPHVRYGKQLLQLGDFAEGLKEFEWRRYLPEARRYNDRYPGTAWAGQDLEGQSVALYAENGYGDAIQFARYAAWLKQRGAQVLVDCRPPLHRLFSALPWVDAVYDGEEDQLPYDYFAPLLSLPHLMGLQLDAPGSAEPYLNVQQTQAPVELLQSSGLRVGLVWAGNPAHPNDRQRSLPLSTLDLLSDTPGVSWFGLQYGPPREQLQGPLRMRITDLGPHITDFLDLAQLIHHMDLVLTVDTAAAHVAGAMGKRTWLLLDEQADWRWLLERNDSPFYPSMRLFRQERLGAWEPLLARVGNELAAAAQSNVVAPPVVEPVSG